MESRGKRGLQSKSRQKRRLWLGAASLVVCVGLAAAGLLLAERFSPEAESTAEQPLPMLLPAPEAAEFQMTGLERGWVRFADGAIYETSDGGENWSAVRMEADDESGAPLASGTMGAGTVRQPSSGEGAVQETSRQTAAPAPAADAGAAGGTEAGASVAEGADMQTGGTIVYLAPDAQPSIQTIELAGERHVVRQSQFATARIGWALLGGGTDRQIPLLVTVDGGDSWSRTFTAEVRTAFRDESERESLAAKEAALYPTPEAAKTAMRSAWSVLPEQAAVGDAVLVRHALPGEVDWQGKTYPLQPFGTGYYTYLPVGMSVKPGEYAIGDKKLKVTAKTFSTQHLQVSQQMESMRQDTERIAADQKKIDAARSKSAAEFLYDSPFVQPIEGRLTTPYGYTRYVNGKWASSHTAIDLAAKQGTPIKATNDGVVALADSLYLTGNAIYIDHGMGLFSQYAHLHELNVKTGDKVKKGDIIGTVGSTGFSTGPHLHFTFWMHNVPTNPNRFFDTTPFHWGGVQP